MKRKPALFSASHLSHRRRRSLPAVAGFALAGALAARAEADTSPSAASPPSQPSPAAGHLGLGENVWRGVHELFTWKHGRIGVYPTFQLEVGQKNTAGVALFAREVFHPANQLRLLTAGGTDGLVEAHAVDRLAPFGSSSGIVYLRGHYRRRPDAVFYGLGGESRSDDKTFFRLTEPELGLGLQRALGRAGRGQVELLYRTVEFSGSDFSSRTPGITQRFGGAGQAALPPGWSGYSLVQGRIGWSLDSRGERQVGSGLRLSAQAAYSLDPGDTALAFLSWGGTVGGLADLSGRGHLLGLELAGEFLARIGDREVPFTELPSLGGQRWLRGFLPGRLRGEDALVGTLSYRQPIVRMVEGELFLALGNVFENGLGRLSRRHLYGSYGLRVETTFSQDVSVGLLAGAGSSRLDGADFVLADDIRINLGVNHSF